MRHIANMIGKNRGIAILSQGELNKPNQATLYACKLDKKTKYCNDGVTLMPNWGGPMCKLYSTNTYGKVIIGNFFWLLKHRTKSRWPYEANPRQFRVGNKMQDKWTWY